MSSNLLLSPQLRKEVLDVVEASFKKAEKHFKQKFSRPEVRFDIHNTNGGEAWYAKNRIRLNLTFLVENKEKFLRTTVPHEVAHLVAKALHPNKKIAPHGAEWGEVMALFDMSPHKKFVKHDYDITSLDRRPKDPKPQLTDDEKRLRKLVRIVAAIQKLDEDEYSDFIDLARAEGVL